jgi:hypothetical protein
MRTLRDVTDSDEATEEGQLGSVKEMVEFKDEMDDILEYTSTKPEKESNEETRTVATNTTK